MRQYLCPSPCKQIGVLCDGAAEYLQAIRQQFRKGAEFINANHVTAVFPDGKIVK